jgi:transposase InsO family protein
VHHRRYNRGKEAIKDITEYIEVFGNRLRPEQRLTYLSPCEFLKEFYAVRKVA